MLSFHFLRLFYGRRLLIKFLFNLRHLIILCDWILTTCYLWLCQLFSYLSFYLISNCFNYFICNFWCTFHFKVLDFFLLLTWLSKILDLVLNVLLMLRLSIVW